MTYTRRAAKNEGEGSYEATRHYNEGVAKSVAEGRSAALGKAASTALDGPEGPSLRTAERAAKSGHAVHAAIDASTITPHLPVVCSEGGQFAIVDHMDGPATIKLQKDEQGRHHYMPLSWVTFVDDKVHVDRPGDQAMRDWSSTPSRT